MSKAILLFYNRISAKVKNTFFSSSGQNPTIHSFFISRLQEPKYVRSLVAPNG